MVGNGIVFLAQGGLKPGAVLDHTVVVTADLGWVVNGHSKHPQLVAQCLEVLHTSLHRNEFTGECT